MNDNPNTPDWYEEGIKAITWLEEQRETGVWFSPFAIAAGSKVNLPIVELAIANAERLIERKGKKVRFNLQFQIEQGIQRNVELGLMTEVSPGTFALTEKGRQYTQHLLMTDPKAQAFARKLMR